MCQFNKTIICGLFLALTLHTSADVEMKAPDEKLVGLNRPWSKELLQFEPEHLHRITTEKLAEMSLEDPLLRYAYIQVFLQNFGGLENLEGEYAVILSDMRRRGEMITQLLLNLANQNQDTMFESRMLNRVAEIGNIDLEPYLEYARTLLRERKQTIDYTLAECASLFLANHGAKQDQALLEQVIAERPYVAPGVTKSLKVLERRLERTKQATRPILRGDPSASGAATDGAAEEAEKQSVANRDGNVSKRSWIIWVLFGIITVVILIWRWKSKSTI
jgi:hypothetical protein